MEDCMIESIQHYRKLGWRVGSNNNGQLIYSQPAEKGQPEKFFAITASQSVLDFADGTKNARRQKWI